MHRLKTVFFVLGALVLVALVYMVGTEPITQTLGRLRWWQVVLVCLPYAGISVMDTLGWRYAFARDEVPFARLYGARIVGEALNIVTAVGQVGGEAAKAWLVRGDVAYDRSVPSVVIAKTTIVIGQALFLLTGTVVAWVALDLEPEILTAMLWLLGVEAAAVGGFLGAQLSGLVARGGRVLSLFGVSDAQTHAGRLDEALRAYYRDEPRRFALSVAFHYAGWLLSAGEALVMLWALGIDAGAIVATVVEALGSGVRFATFLVPASLGALEGANAAVFAALGLTAGAGLAYSFVRRARQVVWVLIGVVVLLVMRPSR